VDGHQKLGRPRKKCRTHLNKIKKKKKKKKRNIVKQTKKKKKTITKEFKRCNPNLFPVGERLPELPSRQKIPSST